MIFAAVLLSICQIVSIFGACLVLRHVINAKQAEIEAKVERALREWVESPEPGKPSKLALVLDSAGAVVGSAAARSLMASMKQDVSSVAHVANGASDLITAQQNPLVGMLTGGKRGKGAALMRLAELIGPMLGGKGSGNGTNDSGSKPPTAFSL